MCETYLGKDFKAKYYSPIVYIWKRGEDYLYIGKCYYGFHRVVNNRLHAVFKERNIEDMDTIEIHYYKTYRECLRAEKELIHTHSPLYNFKQGPKLEGEGYKDEILEKIVPNHLTKEQEKARNKLMRELLKGK